MVKWPSFKDLGISSTLLRRLPSLSIQPLYPTRLQTKIFQCLKSRENTALPLPFGLGKSLALLLHALNVSTVPRDLFLALLLMHNSNSARQMESWARRLTQESGIKVSALFRADETTEKQQLDRLERSGVLIATINRLKDLEDLGLEKLRFLAVDEADLLKRSGIGYIMGLVKEIRDKRSFVSAFVWSLRGPKASKLVQEEYMKLLKSPKSLVLIGLDTGDIYRSVPVRRIPSHVEVSGVLAHRNGTFENLAIPEMPQAAQKKLEAISDPRGQQFDVEYRKYMTGPEKLEKLRNKDILHSMVSRLALFIKKLPIERCVVVVPDWLSIPLLVRLASDNGLKPATMEQGYSNLVDDHYHVLFCGLTDARGSLFPQLDTIISLGTEPVSDSDKLELLALRPRLAKGLCDPLSEFFYLVGSKDGTGSTEPTFRKRLIIFEIPETYLKVLAMGIYRSLLGAGMNGLDHLQV